MGHVLSAFLRIQTVEANKRPRSSDIPVESLRPVPAKELR